MNLNNFLLAFGRGQSKPRDRFVARSKTSLQYLRHIASGVKVPSVSMCIAIEKASGGAVRCESLRKDVDWAYLKRR